jgi:hydrogenase 3 maturation protease
MAADRQLLESLSPWRGSKAVILGVGNTLRGDDGAGPMVCERLSGRVSANVIDAGAAPENYIRPILESSPDVLLIVDAVDFGGRPGEIRLFAPGQLRQFAFSTHALSLHLLIDVIGREKDLEACLVGMQADKIALGDSLSPAMREAVETVADTLVLLFPPAG